MMAAARTAETVDDLSYSTHDRSVDDDDDYFYCAANDLHDHLASN